MQNECLNFALNDCSPNADCFDTPSGYNCKCKQPFKDHGPAEHPGRICLYNECQDPTRNKCDKNAICEDTEDGFTCRCKVFYKASFLCFFRSWSLTIFGL